MHPIIENRINIWNHINKCKAFLSSFGNDITCWQKKLLIQYIIVLRCKAYTFFKNYLHSSKVASWVQGKIQVGKELSKCLIPPLAQNSISYEIKPGCWGLCSVLNTAKDGDCITFLSNLFQCLTALIMKKFFLMSSLNLCFLSQATLSKAWLHLLGGLLTGVGRLLDFLSKSSCLHKSIYCFKKVWLAAVEQSYLFW